MSRPPCEVGKTYHCTLDIRAALQWPDRKLKHMLVNRETGAKLTPDECREQFIEYLRLGYDVLPTCDNTDAKGNCLGHPLAASQPPTTESEARNG